MERKTEETIVGNANHSSMNRGVGRESLRGHRVRSRPCSLERVWAVAQTEAKPVTTGTAPRQRCREAGAGRAARVAEAPASRPKVEAAFYRKYTEAMLRRYMRLSVEAGRVPSLLGREMFRGNVTSYRVSSFEDVVLFCIDVERCLARLSDGEKDMIRRVALQQYSRGEAAALLGISLRCAVVRYAEALDRLTGLLIDSRMLEPLKSCQ